MAAASFELRNAAAVVRQPYRRIDIAAACHAEIPVGIHRVCPPVSRVFAHNGFIVIITDAFDASLQRQPYMSGKMRWKYFFGEMLWLEELWLFLHVITFIS